MTTEPLGGRVVASHGRNALVECDDGSRLRCRLYGRRLSVVCGDRVQCSREATEGADALITRVEKRHSELARQNQRGDAEVFAANLSQLIVVLAPSPQPDFALCDRYLAAAEWAGLKAVIAANKCDLPAAAQLLQPRLALYRALGYPVVETSKRLDGGTESLTLLLQGETSVLVGQSGVGKSSLTNLLIPGVDVAVQALSLGTDEGRHTTTASTLYHLPAGGDLIDSPGVRDFLPPLPAPARIASGFREIDAASAGCRFNDCRHLREPACAVLEAAAAGTIDSSRVASYRQLLRLAEELLRR